MTASSFIRRMATLALACGMLVAAAAQAQQFPDRPVRIIVPYAAGSTIDTLVRILGQQVSARLGQPVVIENRPGASGEIGTAAAAQAKGDGYTLLATSSNGFITQLSGMSKVDARTAFQPVAVIGSAHWVLATGATSSYETLQQLVDFARSNPGKLNYASLGGGVPQLLGDMLASSQNISIVPVSYKSTMDAQVDVLAGRVGLWITPMASAMPMYKSGKMRILAVSGDARTDLLKDVPTLTEAGYRMLDVDSIFYILAPTGTPKAAVDRLNMEFNKAQDDKAVKDTLALQGMFAGGGKPDEVANTVHTDFTKWSRIVKPAPAK